MNPPPHTRTHSRDLWDYLSDMKHMPSRQDRDELVRQAQADPNKRKRVRLWDYFFRVDPDAVGRPHRQELAQLEREFGAARDRYEREAHRRGQEIGGLDQALVQLRGEMDAAAARADAEAREKVRRVRVRQKVLGLVALAVGGGALAGALFLDLFLGALAVTFCGGPVALVAAAVGAAFLLPLRQAPEVKIREAADAAKAKHLARLRAQESDREGKLAQSREQLRAEAESFNSYAAQCETRTRWLREEIAHLVGQIPAPPSDEEVEAWFRDDVARLKEVAVDKRGLRERLIAIAGVENPIGIQSPAELQLPEMIPPPFKAEKTDRNKHLHARRYTVKPDGTFVSFYGVYNFEYVLVANDVLFTYGTTWDFVTGEQSGERADEINYTKITSILTLKSYREIQTENGKRAMENSPSLTLNLENGNAYSITFPDLTYLRLTNAPAFDPDNWEFDQTDVVENAIKVISERKRVAQNLLTH